VLSHLLVSTSVETLQEGSSVGLLGFTNKDPEVPFVHREAKKS